MIPLAASWPRAASASGGSWRRWARSCPAATIGRPLVRGLRIVFLGSGIVGEIMGPICPGADLVHDIMLAMTSPLAGPSSSRCWRMFAKQRRTRWESCGWSRPKSEDLLLNVLPRSIAEELKAGSRPLRTSSAQRRSSSPTSSTSRRRSSGSRRPRWLASSISPFGHFATLPNSAGSRRSRPSATAHGRRRHPRSRGRTMRGRWHSCVRHARCVRPGARRDPRPRAPNRHQLARSSPASSAGALPLRPLGRRGEHASRMES